jgi:hypothetical protein
MTPWLEHRPSHNTKQSTLNFKGAFPPEICYATMLWIRLISTNHIIGAHSLALVETDSTKIYFLYGNMRAMDVCYGCVLWMRSIVACYRPSRVAVSLLPILNIARDTHLYRTATLRRRIFVAHLSRTAT